MYKLDYEAYALHSFHLELRDSAKFKTSRESIISDGLLKHSTSSTRQIE